MVFLCGFSAKMQVYYYQKTNQNIVFFIDFTTAAKLRVENGRICLVHDGFKFIRYGRNENTRYWRCKLSFKYQCKARLLTRRMNGCEMLKIQNDQHDHNSLRVLKKEAN